MKSIQTEKTCLEHIPLQHFPSQMIGLFRQRPGTCYAFSLASMSLSDGHCMDRRTNLYALYRCLRDARVDVFFFLCLEAKTFRQTFIYFFFLLQLNHKLFWLRCLLICVFIILRCHYFVTWYLIMFSFTFLSFFYFIWCHALSLSLFTFHFKVNHSYYVSKIVSKPWHVSGLLILYLSKSSYGFDLLTLDLF